MIAYCIAAAAVLLSALAVLWQRRRTKQLLETLYAMVDTAIKEDFTQEHFDESRLSALETRLAQYLAASTVSARNLQQEKDHIKTLIGDISHQTKTPIANILLYTQLLSEQELSPQTRLCVDALELQAEKLQQLIDALVKTSRLETGIIALRPTATPLRPVIAGAMNQIAPKAAAKGIELVAVPEHFTALCDPKWTEEALCNLLDNAVKYTAPGGSVSLTVTAYPMFTAIHVTDNGPGIPEAEQAQIFARFYRSSAHSHVEGVGIGLYLVRQIAQGQGGYVKVSSMPGKGSTFSLYLPNVSAS